MGDLYVYDNIRIHKQADHQIKVISLNEDSSFCLEAMMSLSEDGTLKQLICTKCSEELVLINDTCFV